MENKNCFKLVCGAGNEDAEEVEKLVTIYSLAGCNFFDVCAKSEIVDVDKTDNFDVSVKDDSFYCIPSKKDVVLKLMFATEEAFKIANSYGENKDNKGFVWMSYDAVKINSSVDTSKIRNMLRTTGIYYVIGYSVDVDTTDENYYAALDIETSDLESLQVTITATANDGTSTTYEAAPFSNGLKHGFGPYPFNYGDNKNRGQFYIDLSNVIDGLNESNFDTYTWNFNIKDTSPNIDVIIHSLKTYNK